ncbi:hypothetical protein HXX76_003684 [Chlamydomonas incerta]|uniref:CCZ1/INTU/HSP4 first Longin domain-containing protein n=1 Tax=Chlamydomonas incerta TaxID=51695 RepID=A0A835T8L9_CHLIN|nr:hypothetical protein HXX76_003684 [Chlamydomonas incerta]|eukprot:KAG2440829.1 hypothetical protein HXX76_003684 [Chlamydomonas incerta]
MQSQNAPANPVAQFFKSTNLVLTVFDTRRGHCEGEEHDKLLSFFPTVAPVNVRTSIVGLAQAVASFADTLTQDGCRYKSLVAETNKWVMLEVEPAVWLMAVVRKSWASGTATDAAFRSLLTSLYDVFVLLHGRIGTLLEQDPTAFTVRRVLQPLLDEAGARLLRPDAAASREPGGLFSCLANPLAPHAAGAAAAVPLLPTSHGTFQAVQCLVNQLLVASFYGSRLVAGCVVLWSGLPLWSTLGPRDTAALVELAGRALVPAARAAQRARPGGAGTSLVLGGVSGGVVGGAAGETAHETLLCPLQWRAGGGIQAGAPPPPAAAAVGGGGGMPQLPVSSSAAAGPSVTSPSGATAAGGGGGGGGGIGARLPPFLGSFLRPRLRPSMYAPGGAALALPMDSVLPMAHVWLRGSCEWAQLLPYHRGQLLVLAALHDGPPPAPEVLAALAAVLNRGAGPAAAALAAEVPSRSSAVWHEKGHRYCYTDALSHATRYSPAKKVQTLSASCLRHLAHLRSKMDEWETARLQQHHHHPSQEAAAPAGTGGEADGSAAAAAAGGGSVLDGASDDDAGGLVGDAGDAELVVRTAHDAWLVLRAAGGGRRLYTAAEQGLQGPELSLASAAAATEVLSDRLFPGVFLQP